MLQHGRPNCCGSWLPEDNKVNVAWRRKRLQNMAACLTPLSNTEPGACSKQN